MHCVVWLFLCECLYGVCVHSIVCDSGCWWGLHSVVCVSVKLTMLVPCCVCMRVYVLICICVCLTVAVECVMCCLVDDTCAIAFVRVGMCCVVGVCVNERWMNVL